MEKANIYELYNKIQEMKNNPYKNEEKYKVLNRKLITKIEQLINTQKEIIFNDEKNFKFF